MARHPDITGVVLAGGLAVRMGGGEKALLELEGVTLLERVARVLSGLFDEVLVATPHPEALAGAAGGLPLVRDAHPGAGPLAGIHAALAASSRPHAFVASCDLPFLDGRVVSAIAARAGEADVVMPRIGGRYHPLHALYSTDLAGEADRLLGLGRRAVRALTDGRRVLYLTGADLAHLPGHERSFTNLNTPEDLEAARRALREGGA